jgi:hypothetical protein
LLEFACGKKFGDRMGCDVKEMNDVAVGDVGRGFEDLKLCGKLVKCVNFCINAYMPV